MPEKSVSLFLFIQSFLYIRMDAWIFILYFALYSNTILFHLFQPVQIWPLGTLLITVSLWQIPIILCMHGFLFTYLVRGNFLAFWHYKMSQAHPVCLLPQF